MSACHYILWIRRGATLSAASKLLARNRGREVVNELNQLLRRFRQYNGETDWVRLVLEGAGAFAGQGRSFFARRRQLCVCAARSISICRSLSHSLARRRAAFEAVRTSRDAVIALRTQAEVTEILSSSDSGEARPFVSDFEFFARRRDPFRRRGARDRRTGPRTRRRDSLRAPSNGKPMPYSILRLPRLLSR